MIYGIAIDNIKRIILVKSATSDRYYTVSHCLSRFGFIKSDKILLIYISLLCSIVI